jgi:ABC-type cobalamin/Fe3+-siderophores transport system ATPase subunit
MASVLEMEAMAKAKGRPKKPGGEGTQVRIESDLATKARMIATDEGTTVLDLLSGILRPVLDRKFAKIVKRIDSSEVGNE